MKQKILYLGCNPPPIGGVSVLSEQLYNSMLKFSNGTDVSIDYINFFDKKDRIAFTIMYLRHLIRCDLVTFQYFPTLEWILNKSRENPKFAVDLKFFSSPKLGLFFDIYTKLYIGFINTQEFLTLYPQFDLKIKSDRIIVTIEKVNQTQLDIVYYAKETNGKLKRVRLEENNVSIKDKELDGFTNAEVRFFMKVLEEKHHLSLDNIKHILNNISLIK